MPINKEQYDRQTGSKIDVLVVGAGPSGLMITQALARLGVKTMVVDRRGKGEIYGNADGIQPRTLEIFESYGLVHEYLERSAKLNALVIYNFTGSGFVRRPPVVNVQVETRYPYEVTCSIRTIEGVLERSAARHGVHVQYDTQPVFAELEESYGDGVSYPVKVKLSSRLGNSTNIEIVNAKYLIGSDGANSWVRDNFKIPMVGEKTQYIWGVVEGEFKTNFPDQRCKCIIQHPMGAVVLIPREDGLLRIYCQLSGEDVVRNSDGRIDMSKEMRIQNENNVANRIKAILYPYTIDYGQIQWSTVFSVSQMVAAQYSVNNRVFLVGDACHMHSPNAGQGANASMGDGHNLAWKIAHVLRGWASPKMLDTYEVERKAYAQGLIDFDKELAKMMNEGNASKYDEMSAQQNLNTSGVGLHYKSILSPATIVDTVLVPGTRLSPFPITRLADWEAMNLQDLTPSDGLWKLIVFVTPDFDLNPFAEILSSAAWRDHLKKTSVNVIMDAKAENVHWMDMPDALRHWQCIFAGTLAPALRLDDSMGCEGSVFTKYSIDGVKGALVLVRPDGHMSVVEELSTTGIENASGLLSL